MVQSAIAVADRAPAAAVGPPAVTEIRADLLKLFGAVSDGRSGQGRDHPVAAVLALAAAAVVAGGGGEHARSRGGGGGPPPGVRRPLRPAARPPPGRPARGAGRA